MDGIEVAATVKGSKAKQGSVRADGIWTKQRTLHQKKKEHGRWKRKKALGALQ